MLVARRAFLRLVGLVAVLAALPKKRARAARVAADTPAGAAGSRFLPLGADADGKSRVYVSRGGGAEENVRRALDLFGGIDRVVGTNDIVVVKPNAQWWLQGTTNTDNLKGFIEAILEIPGFSGEVVVAENHHYAEKDSRGWTTEKRNGSFNLNELVDYFARQGHRNVTKYHWHDGGPNPKPRQGNAGGGGVVPADGTADGYVWAEDLVYVSPEGRRCMMSYPVFTSAYSGKRIDLRKGVVAGGREDGGRVRLVNFACLNHHSTEFGVTASVKNLMGVVDLTCGYPGTEPDGFYNVHYIGSESTAYSLGKQAAYLSRRYGVGSWVADKLLSAGEFRSEYTGGALGFWMRTVRMPDLNVLAAEYVGWGGRLDPSRRARTNAFALSTDPVALDYAGAKSLLLASTPDHETRLRELNDPEKPPFSAFLRECQAQGVGNLDPARIEVVTA